MKSLKISKEGEKTDPVKTFKQLNGFKDQT